MLHYETKDIPFQQVHKLLLGGVAPRPIALVSTISEDGINNLTPFSFFNAFGANPPIIAFSPSRRGRDGTLKDTYHNLTRIRECVVQCVTYSMVEQASLASTEYLPEVDEFVKSGFTPINSDLVKPKRVKESPFQMECKVLQIISFNDLPSSANIVICEVLKFHVAEDLFVNGIIRPERIDLVARMSGDFYCRANGDAIFEIEKPISKKGIGFDNIPDFIKTSEIYSANDLGKLANTEKLPSTYKPENFLHEVLSVGDEQVEFTFESFYRYQSRDDYKNMLRCLVYLKDSEPLGLKSKIELTAKTSLKKNDLEFAWNTALLVNHFNLI
jgi:flavin reductase (DIM6/NTAB) family NADH-FMN oxidoreductase RutF